MIVIGERRWLLLFNDTVLIPHLSLFLLDLSLFLRLLNALSLVYLFTWRFSSVFVFACESRLLSQIFSSLHCCWCYALCTLSSSSPIFRHRSRLTIAKNTLIKSFFVLKSLLIHIDFSIPYHSVQFMVAVCNIVLNSIGTILFECCHDFFVAFLHERHKSPFFIVPFFCCCLWHRVLHIVFVFVRFFLSRKLYTFDILIGQAANQNSNNCSSSSFSKSKNSNNELIRYKRLLHRSGCGGGNSDDDSHDISSSSYL